MSRIIKRNAFFQELLQNLKKSTVALTISFLNILNKKYLVVEQIPNTCYCSVSFDRDFFDFKNFCSAAAYLSIAFVIALHIITNTLCLYNNI